MKLYQQETANSIAKLANATASYRATVATLMATNGTLTRLSQLVKSSWSKHSRMSPNSLPSFPIYAKTPAQNHPTPEIGITAGLMAILLITPSKNAKKLNPGMIRATPTLIPKGDPLDISPAENGWELSIRKKFQTQHYPSP